MVLLWFKDREVVKHPVRILLSDTCRVEGVSFPVPTMFATRYLLPGVEEAWRLLEEVEGGPFAPRGKKWILEAGSLEEAWIRLEESLRNAPNGEPRFYKSIRDSLFNLELTDGDVCYLFAGDFDVNLPPNVYKCRETHCINVVLALDEFEKIMRMPREFFRFLGDLTSLEGKRKLRKSTIRNLIHVFALYPEGALQHLREVAERVEILNEKDRLFEEASDKPLRFDNGYLCLLYDQARKDRILLIAFDDGRVFSAKYRDVDSLKNAIYRLVKLGKMPRRASEEKNEGVVKMIWRVIEDEQR